MLSLSLIDYKISKIDYQEFKQRPPKPTILYAHGFGVQADDRGLFTDLKATFPDYEHHFVELNDTQPGTGHLITPSMEEQARRLANRA